MRYRVRFGLPGPSADWGAITAMLDAAEHEDIALTLPRGIGHSTVGNFDDLWNEANNAYEAGEVDWYVKLHSDVHPLVPQWLRTLLRVAESRKVSLVSVPIAIKDERAVVSCGVVDNPDDPWIGRMVKITEINKLPLDFDAADLGYPGAPLLHNNGCILFDLRDDRWRATDAEGNSRFCWHFPRRNRRDPETGLWRSEGNSEDWQFSRAVHEMGIPSVITRRVPLGHRGQVLFVNWDASKETAKDYIARCAL